MQIAQTLAGFTQEADIQEKPWAKKRKELEKQEENL